jgi:hypothetical protein
MEQDKVENKCRKCIAKRVLIVALILIAILLGVVVIKKLCFDRVKEVVAVDTAPIAATITPMSLDFFNM